jgi:hypothetical protein
MALKFETSMVVNFSYYGRDFNINNFWLAWAKHGPYKEANYGLKKAWVLNNTTKTGLEFLTISQMPKYGSMSNITKIDHQIIGRHWVKNMPTSTKDQ